MTKGWTVGAHPLIRRYVGETGSTCSFQAASPLGEVLAALEQPKPEWRKDCSHDEQRPNVVPLTAEGRSIE